MSNSMVLVAGILTDSWSAFAKNAPESTNTWVVDELSQDVLVGCVIKHFYSNEFFDFDDFNKSTVLEEFKSYTDVIRKISRNDFESNEAFEEWNNIFSTSEVKVLMLKI